MMRRKTEQVGSDQYRDGRIPADQSAERMSARDPTGSRSRNPEWCSHVVSRRTQIGGRARASPQAGSMQISKVWVKRMELLPLYPGAELALQSPRMSIKTRWLSLFVLGVCLLV